MLCSSCVIMGKPGENNSEPQFLVPYNGTTWNQTNHCAYLEPQVHFQSPKCPPSECQAHTCAWPCSIDVYKKMKKNDLKIPAKRDWRCPDGLSTQAVWGEALHYGCCGPNWGWQLDKCTYRCKTQSFLVCTWSCSKSPTPEAHWVGQQVGKKERESIQDQRTRYKSQRDCLS